LIAEHSLDPKLARGVVAEAVLRKQQAALAGRRASSEDA
jgi:hypothetical protein